MLATLDAPHDRVTFERSKLDTSERIKNAPTYAMYRDLIRLRRTDSVFGLPRPGGVDGAVLGPSAFVLRYFGIDGDDRLVLVNLGHDLEVRPPSEPLLAPPAQARWEAIWSSEDPSYGGGGTLSPEEGGAWHLLGEATVVLRAEKGCPE
jgi:maltooligosyltrehalose trehalohydrolase